jgi:hypothetical protein
MLKKFVLVAVAALALTALSFSAFRQQQNVTAQQSPAVPLTASDEPAWYSAVDIGNGVELELWVGSTATVVDPATSVSERAVSMHINFLYGVGVMQQIDSVKLYALTDVTPASFQMAGIDRNLVAPTRPPHAVLNYSITVTPKTGYTWGTIRGAVDLDIVAIQV